MSTETIPYIKQGGYPEAEKDFFDLDPEGVYNASDYKGIKKIGKLQDGRMIIVREDSDDGRPTLEIQEINSRIKTKIRYGEKRTDK